jgi:hypothetical protein
MSMTRQILGAAIGAAAVLAIAASPAAARLVYVCGPSNAVVVARNDGSDAHVIGHGAAPVLSPDGARVAFFREFPDHTELHLVSAQGGQRRLLLGDAFIDEPSPVYWAPDARHLLAMGTRSRAFLFNVKKRTKHLYRLHDGPLAGAAFSPDSLRLLFGQNSGAAVGDLYLVRTGQPNPRLLGQGDAPTWSKLGVAYHQPGRIGFAKDPEDKPHKVATTAGFPMAVSDSGRRILVVDASHAELVDPIKKTKRRLNVKFDSIDGLSHDGRHILGVVNGDVSNVHSDGSVHVVVPNARQPSWNK